MEAVREADPSDQLHAGADGESEADLRGVPAVAGLCRLRLGRRLVSPRQPSGYGRAALLLREAPHGRYPLRPQARGFRGIRRLCLRQLLLRGREIPRPQREPDRPPQRAVRHREDQPEVLKPAAGARSFYRVILTASTERTVRGHESLDFPATWTPESRQRHWHAPGKILSRGCRDASAVAGISRRDTPRGDRPRGRPAGSGGLAKREASQARVDRYGPRSEERRVGKEC